MPPSMGGPSSHHQASSGLTPTNNVYPPHHADSFSSSTISEDQSEGGNGKGKGVLEGLSGFFHSQEANADWSAQPYSYVAPRQEQHQHHQNARITSSWAGFSAAPEKTTPPAPYQFYPPPAQQTYTAPTVNRGLHLDISQQNAGHAPSPATGSPYPGSARTSRPPTASTNSPVNSLTQASPVISQSPRDSASSASSGAMSTSALLPSNYASGSSSEKYAASSVASSSSAPYPPPSQSMLAAQAFMGPQASNVAEGPGLYSTTGFDMLGVLSRVAARKDPKTVLGPVDFSCSFLVVVCPPQNPCCRTC
jgi:hypothetical protein